MTLPPPWRRSALMRDKCPNARVVVVADHYRSTEPDLAFQVGAAGYLVSDMSCDAFVKSLELVMMGEAVFPPAFQTSAHDTRSEYRRNAAGEDDGANLVMPDDASAPQLSPRELAILRCLINGNSNKCIARKIDIAEATVKVHVKRILRKAHAVNRTQAALWAIAKGMAAPPSVVAPPQGADAAQSAVA